MLLNVFLLLQVERAPGFTTVKHPGATPELGTLLRDACTSVPGGSRAVLLKQELQFSARVNARPVTAGSWSALGCARVLLSLDGAIPHDGPLMIAGESWEAGSVRAMFQALSANPVDPRAANVLALLALTKADPGYLKQAAEVILAAVHGGVTSPAVLRACSEFALRTNRPEDTYACARKALDAGSDSTWHLLRIARLGFRAGDTVGGAALFSRAASAAHDSITRLEVDWHLQWFLSPEERVTWAALPDSMRGRWVVDRLATRDVRDGQPRGARLAEHFARLDYVEAHFRLDVPIIEQANKLHVRQALDRDARLGGIPRYIRWQIDIDDRGVTYMRFGKPEKTADGCHVESWLYTIDGGPVLLTFAAESYSRTPEMTRLVVGVYTTCMCGLEPWRCNIAKRAEGNMRPNWQDLEEIRREDRQYIAYATQRDDNGVRPDAVLAMVSSLHRLWDPVTAQPMALVTWAIRTDGLAPKQSDSSRTIAVDLSLRRWDPSLDAWDDTAFTRRMVLPDSTSRRMSVTGFILVPSSPGVTTWSLIAAQPPGRLGRVHDEGEPLSAGDLALSDLVLGAMSQGLTWNNHGAAVALAPLDALDRNEAVQLYYQIRSGRDRAQVRTTIALYRTDAAKASSEPALQVAYSGGLRSGINEVAPTLDVSRLEKGSYRLEVQVEDASNRLTVIRSTRLNLY